MSNFCQHCGRQLQDGELQFADGCQYCAGRNRQKTKRDTDANSGSVIFGLLVFVGIVWLLAKIIFG